MCGGTGSNLDTKFSNEFAVIKFYHTKASHGCFSVDNANTVTTTDSIRYDRHFKIVQLIALWNESSRQPVVCRLACFGQSYARWTSRTTLYATSSEDALVNTDITLFSSKSKRRWQDNVTIIKGLKPEAVHTSILVASPKCNSNLKMGGLGAGRMASSANVLSG